MRRHYLVGTIAALALLASSGLLHAQHQSRSLAGVISDKHHEPLRGAIVQARNLDTQTVVSYITDQDGHYRFKRLDGDCDYKISAAWHNQRSSQRDLSLFDSNPAKVINLTIKTQ